MCSGTAPTLQPNARKKSQPCRHRHVILSKFLIFWSLRFLIFLKWQTCYENECEDFNSRDHRDFQWSHWNYFHNNAKTPLALFPFSLEGRWRFSEATSCELSQQIECRAEMGIQLSPIKPDIKEIYGNMKVPLLSLNCFIFKKTMIVHKTMLLVLACNGFVNVIFKWVNVKYI